MVLLLGKKPQPLAAKQGTLVMTITKNVKFIVPQATHRQALPAVALAGSGRIASAMLLNCDNLFALKSKAFLRAHLS
jgi:hypothetical protein